MPFRLHLYLFFFFNDTATTEISTLSLHDALPISPQRFPDVSNSDNADAPRTCLGDRGEDCADARSGDRKSTRLNSSHVRISYAVFCLKKKIARLLCLSV